MKAQEFENLARDRVFNTSVKILDKDLYRNSGLVYLEFTLDSILMYAQGKEVKSISYDEIEKVLFKIQRSADMAIRFVFWYARYIFEGRFNILTKDNKCYRFALKDVRMLKELSYFLESRQVVIDDLMMTKDNKESFHVLDLIDVRYSYNEQYNVLNKHAFLFDKTKEQYYKEKRI